MRCRLGAVLLLSACALAGCKKTVEVGGDPGTGEPVTIKVKEPEVGAVRDVRSSTTNRLKQWLADLSGKHELRNSKDETVTVAYKETILEKPAGADRPTRLQREYTQAEVKAEGATQKLPFADKTVLIEKKGGIYRFSAAGKPLPGGEIHLLHLELNASVDVPIKLFLPDKPVRVGESWSPAPEPILAVLGKRSQLKVDPAKTTCTAKLLRTHEQGGKKFGVLEVKLGATPTSIFGGGGADEKSRLEFTKTVDLCIDGTATDAEARTSFLLNLVGGHALNVEASGTETAKELIPLQPPPKAGR